jgi:hypothetical protein
MENLSIKHNSHAVLRKVLGVIAFLCGIIWIIISIGTPKPLNIILGIFWTLMGFAYFLSSSGANTSTVQVGEGSVKIKWMNWLRSKLIQDSEIEKITLTKLQILIDRKGSKQVKLPMDFFELEQKREVYTYFIELSKQRNYPLEKIGFGQ